MKLNIKLEEDRQLRKEVLDLVKGQLKAFTREELRSLLIANGNALTPQRIEQLAKEEIIKHIRAVVNTPGSYGDNRSELKKIIRVETQTHLRGLSDFIKDEIARQIGKITDEYIKTIVSDRVSASVKSHLSKILTRD